tara:strand:- start:82421 stop:83290 length:870 start_codon:yes stop_codon:yes gene_type:complete
MAKLLTILSFLLVSGLQVEAGILKNKCSFLFSEVGYSVRIQSTANGRFPQNDELIEVAMLSSIVSGELHPRDFLRQPNVNEMLMVAGRMNELHKKFNVPFRYLRPKNVREERAIKARNVIDSDGNTILPMNRLVGLMVHHQIKTLQRLAIIIDQLDPLGKPVSGYLEIRRFLERSQFSDRGNSRFDSNRLHQFASLESMDRLVKYWDSPESYPIKVKLEELGAIYSSIFSSPEMQAAGKNHFNILRNRDRSGVNGISKVFSDLLWERLEGTSFYKGLDDLRLLNNYIYP